MKRLLVISAILMSLAMFANGQNDAETKCKYLKPKKAKAFNTSIPENIQQCTRPRILFDKGWFAASTSLLTKGDSTYLMLTMSRRFSPKFEFLPENKMILQLEDGNTVNLTPLTTFSGKHKIEWFHIRCFYAINETELDVLSNSPVEMVTIYISPLNSMENVETDDTGTYFEKSIESERYKRNIMNYVKCIE